MCSEVLDLESVSIVGLFGTGAQRSTDCRCQLFCVLRIDSSAECSVDQRIDAAVFISTDYTEPGRHSFQEDNAEALAQARHYKYVCKPKKIRQRFRVDHANKSDALPYTHFFGKRYQPR